MGVVGVLSSLPLSQSLAACLTCPQNATDTASGSAFAVHVTRGGVDRTLGEGASVGACETLRLQSLVQYAAVGTSGGVGSGFTGGTGAVFIIARGSTTGIKEFLGNVTPADMGSTLVTVTNPLVNPNLCIPPAGTVAVEAKAMLTNVYNLTTADINAGSIRFRFEYTGTSLLQDPVTGQCLDTTDQAQEKTVRIAPLPTCTITPPARLCPGSCEDITVTVIGQGPIVINLTGPGVNVTSNNIGTTGVLSTNTVTFPNIACAPGSGLTNSYTAAISDFAGCAGSCSTTLAGTPLPICTITGDQTLLVGSCANITVTASGGTPPLNIVVTKDGTVYTNCNNCSSLTFQACASTTAGVTNTYVSHITDSSAGSTASTVCTTNCTTHIISFGTPKICVTKQVACFLGTNTACPGGASPDLIPIEPIASGENCGHFDYIATGVQATNNAVSPPQVLSPAFCYLITVTNCGQIDLTNVTVNDSVFGDLTSDFFGATPHFLRPTEGRSFIFKATIEDPLDNQIYALTNTVITTGVGITNTATGTGTTVSAQTNAVAIVVPAAVECTKYYSLNGGPLTNNVTLPCNSTNYTVVWYVGFTNVGKATLLHGTVLDEDAGCLAHFEWTNCLAPGQGVLFAVCTNSNFECTNCSGGLENTVIVLADRFTTNTSCSTVCSNLLCAYTINGSNIVAGTSCSATLSCSTPVSCRVTGGGRQDLPEACPTDVRYVTHGGQVGAPVGNQVCTIDTTLPNYWLGNPCIHGRWTHVRHVKGGLEGNFHARFFDTLDCACLDTNMGPNCQYGPGTVTDGVCGNRNIGPEPRRAPANKIAFTGVGDWACPNGRREGRACLFRVDIEDRGEPGNAHALDRNGKEGRVPDRYRIRIWVLSDAELAQLNSGAGADPYLLNFRNCISACNGIDFRDGVSCNFQTNECASNDSCSSGGGGSIGFGNAGCTVRLPNIDDGGELLHGNHQIHPSIKSCDPHNPTGPGLAKP